MANKKTCGIYKITNTITNETYIGQSKNIEKRIATHKEDLEKGIHVNKGLQEDYNLAKSLSKDYEIFNFEIVKVVDKKDLNKEEMYWINDNNSFERGYNRTIGGSHDDTKGHVDYGGGRLFTDEKRIKLIKKELTNDFDNKDNYIFKTTSKEILCSECGKEFNDEFDYCPYCGTKKPLPKICPKCKLEPSIEFSFCPKCGTELVDKEEYLKEQEEIRLRKIKEKKEKILKMQKEAKILIENGEKCLDSYEFNKALKNYKDAQKICHSLGEDIIDTTILTKCNSRIELTNKTLIYENFLENYRKNAKNNINIEEILRKYLEEFLFFENLSLGNISNTRIKSILIYFNNIEPNFENINFWYRIICLKYLKKYRLVLSYYDDAINSAPITNPSLRCKIWYSKGKFLEEIEYYEKAIAIYDYLMKRFDYYECLIDRANCLKKLGKAKEAKICEEKYFKKEKIRKRPKFEEYSQRKWKICPICGRKYAKTCKQCYSCYYNFYKVEL